MSNEDTPTGRGVREAMTKVIAFKPRLVSTAPLDEIDKWLAFDEEHGDKIAEATDALMMMLEWRFGFTADDVSSADYTLLIEAAINLCMRTKGIKHPILQEIADKYYSESER